MAGIKVNFFALIGFITQLMGIISAIDTSGDGKIDGKEKLAAAQRAAQALLQSFPNLHGSIPPEKMERLINLLVEALNLFVKA